MAKKTTARKDPFDEPEVEPTRVPLDNVQPGPKPPKPKQVEKPKTYSIRNETGGLSNSNIKADTIEDARTIAAEYAIKYQCNIILSDGETELTIPFEAGKDG